jgi:quercetin dioxygenase-like cupin family protein
VTVLKQGAIVKEHRAPDTAVVQALSGRIQLRIETQAVELSAGQIVDLERNLPHAGEALEESAFAFTVAWRSVLGDERGREVLCPGAPPMVEIGDGEQTGELPQKLV